MREWEIRQRLTALAQRLALDGEDDGAHTVRSTLEWMDDVRKAVFANHALLHGIAATALEISQRKRPS